MLIILGLILVVSLLIVLEMTKTETEGPKKLTEMFDPQITLKRRKRFVQPFKDEVIRYAWKYGAIRAVERYAYLGVTRRDILRWMKSDK